MKIFLWKVMEGKWRWYKEMERYPLLFMNCQRINILQIVILLKVIYRFNTTPIKILMTFFTEIEQLILKFINNHKKPQITKSNPEEKEQSWKHHIPDFHCTTKLQWSKQQQQKIKQNTVTAHFICGKNTRHTDQLLHSKPRHKPMHLQILIYDKGGKITMKKKTVFSTIGAGKLEGYR